METIHTITQCDRYDIEIQAMKEELRKAEIHDIPVTSLMNLPDGQSRKVFFDFLRQTGYLIADLHSGAQGGRNAPFTLVANRR